MVTRPVEVTYYNFEHDTAPKNRVTVLYGDFGKRKTTTACAMVKDKGLLISADGSWTVLEKDVHSELRKKVTLVEFQGLSQARFIKYEGHDTIIVDPVSSIVDYYLDLLSDKGGWGSTGSNYRETIKSDDPELKDAKILHPIDYRATRDKFRPFLGKIIMQPAHVIFTSHAYYPLRGLSPDMTIRPDIPASTWKILGRRADIIGYIEPASGGKFRIDLRENSSYAIGKSRITGLSGVMDLDNFVKKYREVVL